MKFKKRYSMTREWTLQRERSLQVNTTRPIEQERRIEGSNRYAICPPRRYRFGRIELWRVDTRGNRLAGRDQANWNQRPRMRPKKNIWSRSAIKCAYACLTSRTKTRWGFKLAHLFMFLKAIFFSLWSSIFCSFVFLGCSLLSLCPLVYLSFY